MLTYVRYRLLNASIREKLTALTALIVGASIALQTLLGTQLISNDKRSYVYQLGANRTQALVEKLDERIERLNAFAATLAKIQGERLTGDEVRVALYNFAAAQLSVIGVAAYSIDESSKPKLLMSYGAHPRLENTAGDDSFLRKLKKTSTITHFDGEQTNIYLSGTLSYHPIIYAIRVSLKDIFETYPVNENELLLIGADSSILFRKGFETTRPSTRELKRIFSVTNQQGLRTSTSTWALNDRSFLASYTVIPRLDLVVADVTDSRVTAKAANSLQNKAALLGLSILILAFGLISLTIRPTLARLNLLWEGTRELGKGNFSIAISAPSEGGDEIADLSRSFMLMTRKIEALLVEAADKARMAKELETAQMLQATFTPSMSFNHHSLSVSGVCHSSSECAGDWWSYVKCGEEITVVIGDVTGHGASSALLTASVHAVFTHITSSVRSPSELSLSNLLEILNESVYKIGRGDTTVTFLACKINLRTGLLTFANAGHLPPLLIRKGTDEDSPDIVSLVSTPANPLGFKPELDIAISPYQLHAGDTVALFTDGIFDPRAVDGKKFKKKSLAQLIYATNRAGKGSEAICQAAINTITEHFGYPANPLKDDATLVVATVPITANFSEQ